jgi:AcrR family transcriptional regulator
MSGASTSELIVHHARQILAERGPGAMSMRRVAAAVGVTPMAIYRHFSDRDALLRRIREDSFAELTRHWQARAGGSDVMARLRALHEVYLDYALAEPYLFDHAFSTHREEARRYPEDFRARRSPTLNLIADAVAEGIDAGVLREDDPWDAAMTLWAHTHGLIALYRAGRFSFGERDFRTFYKQSLQRLFDGMAA